MTEREKFEKWFSVESNQVVMFDAENNAFVKQNPENKDHQMANTLVNMMWFAWQAATKAAVPQWIPVGERLPMDGENVLIFDKFGTHGSIYTLVYYDEFMLKHEGVTHWMPLPPKPDVSSDDPLP